jgi:hypothetical protein
MILSKIYDDHGLSFQSRPTVCGNYLAHSFTIFQVTNAQISIQEVKKK